MSSALSAFYYRQVSKRKQIGLSSDILFINVKINIYKLLQLSFVHSLKSCLSTAFFIFSLKPLGRRVSSKILRLIGSTSLAFLVVAVYSCPSCHYGLWFYKLG